MKRILALLLSVVILGCSSNDDDNGVMETPVPEVASFIAIGEDLENVYQYTFDASTESGQQINLTEQFSIPTDFLTLRQVDDVVSFYAFTGGAFTLTLVDVITGAQATYPDIFANSAGRSVAWGTNTTSNVFFGFFGPGGTRDLGIQDVELLGTTVQDSMIDEDIEFSYQPLLFEDKIYITYLDNQGNYKLSFYDTVTKEVGEILDFGDIPISILITDTGDLAVVNNGVAASLEIYDSTTLEFMERFPLDFNTGFSPGPVDGAVFKDGKLFYAFPYVQPSRYPSGPAVFNIDSQENTIVDFFGIADAVEQDLGFAINVTAQIYDAAQNVFLVGYSVPGVNTVQGGVLQISVGGALITNIPLDFLPTYFVRD